MPPTTRFRDLPASGPEHGSLRVRLPRLRRWLALHRPGLYWMDPRWGGPHDPLPAETQLLLWQDTSGTAHAILPLVAHACRAVLRADDVGKPVLAWNGAAPGTPLAVESTAPTALAAVQAAVRAARERLGTFRLRTEKPAPAFADLLGWCTWDAFYQSVDRAGVLQGLDTFARAGVRPGFMILDDGWLDIRPRDHLRGFDADTAKFPGGLARLVRDARRRGVRIFGVWHALMGYWAGLDATSALGASFRLVSTRGNLRPWEGTFEEQLHLVHPDDAPRFFSEFHGFLARCGVGMVKVDGQSALELFCGDQLDRVTTMRAWQQALQGSVAVNFAGNSIHCMCHGSDVLFHLAAAQGWRNSGDYRPTHQHRTSVGQKTLPPPRPPEVQQVHIIQNAANALLASQIALPDWDMFQTHQPEARFHAVARAISGGPVYVCDTPGKQDVSVLRLVARADGRVLRYPEPGLPREEEIWENPAATPRALRILARGAHAAAQALFHVHADAAPVTAPVRPADVFPGARGLHALWFHLAQRLALVPAGRAVPLRLGQAEAEMVTAAPVQDGIAALGCIDLLAGGASVRSAAWIGDAFVCDVTFDGASVYWCRTAPSRVEVDGKRARVRVAAPAFPVGQPGGPGGTLVHVPVAPPSGARIVIRL